MRRCSRVTPSLNASFARRSLRKSACSVLAVRASASTATATSVPPYEGASPPMHPASNPRRGPRPPRPVCAENDGERRVRRRVERRIRAKAVAIRGGVVSSEAIPAKNERAATQRGGPGIGSSASVSTASGPGWSRASGAPRTVGHGVGVQARLRCATTQRERLFFNTLRSANKNGWVFNFITQRQTRSIQISQNNEFAIRLTDYSYMMSLLAAPGFPAPQRRRGAKKMTRRTYFNDGDELVAPTLPREPERARRKGGAGCTLTATPGLSSRASRALLPVAEQSTAVVTRSRHGGNIGLAKLDARAERQAGLSSASDGTSRTRARGDVANARHASSRTGLEPSRARTIQGTSPVRRTSVPGETRPKRSSRQRFFDRVFFLKKRA